MDSTPHLLLLEDDDDTSTRVERLMRDHGFRISRAATLIENSGQSGTRYRTVDLTLFEQREKKDGGAFGTAEV